MTSSRTTFAAWAFLAAAPLAGQSLILDIMSPTGGNGSSGVERYHPVLGKAVFAASSDYGIEPWVTDGTPQGTRILIDLMPNGSSLPGDFVRLGNELLFVAEVPGLGRELWKTDGTPTGTVLVKDIRPGTVGGNPTRLVLFGGAVWFAASDGIGGDELWRSDGTSNGTVQAIDYVAGPTGCTPQLLTPVGSRLFFVASTAAHGRELHVTDGTLQGTSLVADLRPGTGSTAFGELAAFGTRLLFAADSGLGLEPHVSDGTAAGTVALGDLNPGSAHSTPSEFRELGSLAVFSAEGGGLGREPWVTDGTAAGTSMLVDANPGANGSDPRELIVWNGAVWFGATNAAGRELWRSDGSGSGTALFADLHAGSGSSSPGEFAVVGTELWFSAASASFGTELWRSDGSVPGTTVLFDFAPGNAGTLPRAITPLGSLVLLAGIYGSSSIEPLVTDGTLAGTSLLFDIVRAFDDSSPRDFTEVGGRVYFAANRTGFGDEPWWTDGTPAGTSMVADVQPGSFSSRPSFPAALDATRVVFAADLFSGGWQLFVSDAATQVTTQLTNGAPAPQPRGMVGLGSLAVFSADSPNGREPWVTDGTAAGTFELIDLRPGSADGVPLLTEDFTATASYVFFSADDGVHGDELWRSDGTPGGTVLVADLRPGSSGSQPERLTQDGNRIWFTANGASSGRELWRSDGSPAGTTMIEVAPGLVSSWPEELTVGGGRLYFTALVAGRREIWSSDGTAAGTTRIVPAAFAQQSFSDLVWTQAGLFFLTDDDSGFGRELWITDGSPSGTQRISDIGPDRMHGPLLGTPTPVLGDSKLLFAAHDPTHGLQLWLSDGTNAGTQRASYFGASGYGAASFTNWRALGTRVFFGCSDGVTGLEPWVFDPSTGSAAYVLAYGPACRGSTGLPQIGAVGLPRLGNASFAITVSQALPNAAATQLFSFFPSNVPLSSCRINLAIPMLTGASLVTDLSGSGAAPLAIPNDPAYLGVNLFTQWVVLDPLGGIYQVLAATSGLQIRVGL